MLPSWTALVLVLLRFRMACSRIDPFDFDLLTMIRSLLWVRLRLMLLSMWPGLKVPVRFCALTIGGSATQRIVWLLGSRSKEP